MRKIEDAVDLWVASIDEYDNAAPSDRVPQRLAELGPQHTMLYDNEIPGITEAATRTRLFAWCARGLIFIDNGRCYAERDIASHLLLDFSFFHLVLLGARSKMRLTSLFVRRELWRTHSTSNNVTHGRGLGGSLSWFMDDGWTEDPWISPDLGQGPGKWFLVRNEQFVMNFVFI